MRRPLRATLLASVVFASVTVNAQQPLPVPSASGRELWLVYQKNFRDFVINERTQAAEPAAPLELELYLASSHSTTGYVEIPALGFRHDFTLAPGRLRVVAIPPEAQLRGSAVVEKLGVHVVAEQPVTVYALNRRYQTSDTYLVIPVEALGTDYRAVGYRKLQQDLISQLAVVATENNTVVRIMPSVPVRQFAPPEAPVAKAPDASSEQAQREAELAVADASETQHDPTSFEVQSVDTEPTFSYQDLKQTIVVPALTTMKDARPTVAVADVLVKADGTVREIRFLDGEEMEHVRLMGQALLKIRFSPARRNNTPVAGWVRIPVDLSAWNFGGEPGGWKGSEQERAFLKRASKQEGRIIVSTEAPVRNTNESERADGTDRTSSSCADATIPPPEIAAELKGAERRAGTERIVLRDAVEHWREDGSIPTPIVDTTAPVAVAPGQPIEVVLNKGEAFQIIPKYDPNGASDLTGTRITSTRPVAVFSGHNCAYVPDLSVKACNLLAEQMPPTSSWGRTFGVGAIEARSYSVVRVLAREDSTMVTVGGKHVATLHAGEHFEDPRLVGNALIVTSRPALVTQFSPGFGNGDGVGDPMMIVVPPVEQFDNVYTIATPVRGSFRHYLNVVARTEEIDKLAVDGHPVDQTRFTPLGESGLSIGRLEIAFGSHTVSGAERFGLYQYGLGFDDAAYDAYGNAAGQLYIDLDKVEQESGEERELPDIGMLGR